MSAVVQTFKKACRCTINGGPIAETGSLRLEARASADGQTISVVAIFNGGPTCTVCREPWVAAVSAPSERSSR